MRGKIFPGHGRQPLVPLPVFLTGLTLAGAWSEISNIVIITIIIIIYSNADAQFSHQQKNVDTKEIEFLFQLAERKL